MVNLPQRALSVRPAVSVATEHAPHLFRCAPSPDGAPTQSLAPAAEPVAVPAPAPAAGSNNGTDVGSLLQPILAGVEGILGGQPTGNSTTPSGGIAGLFG